MHLCLFLWIILFLTGCQTGYYQGPPSDHFDGKKFFYPGEKDKKVNSTYELFSLWVDIMKHPWPKNRPKIHYSTFPNYPQNTKITLINHSTVLIQTNTVNFLLDPIYSFRASPFQWIGPYRVQEPGIKFADLPKIDVVLISHNHYDHMDLSTIKALKNSYHPLFIVPLGNKKYLQRHGIDNVVELDWWQQKSFKNFMITFLPAKHDTQRRFSDYNRTLWGSFGISGNGKKFYFAGDTAYASHFKEIRKRWGKPDIAFIPIGAYEPHKLLKNYHVNPKEAVQAHLELGSRTSIGIHWGTFQLASESIDRPVIDLDIGRHHYQVPEKNFFVVREGVPIYLRSN